MSQIKRQTSGIDSDNQLIKYVRQSSDDNQQNFPSCIEDLSNELLLEIFDYFHACELYETFANLNGRFQTLLDAPFYGLKINECKYFSSSCLCCVEIIMQNKHRILSLHMKDLITNELLFKSITFDQSFHRLESLSIYIKKQENLRSLVTVLPLLPHLISFSIRTSFSPPTHRRSSKLYKLIFNLPTLKYLKISCLRAYRWPLPLSININNNSCNIIEHMTITQPHSLYELLIILSYTPQLRHLICRSEHIYSDENTERKLSITLPNLHSLSMSKLVLEFDQFESFLLKICSQLLILRMAIDFTDLTYLNANRWQQLLSRHMPDLHTFSLKYSKNTNEVLQISEYSNIMDPSVSSFWIERKLNLKLMVDQNYGGNRNIFEICSKKKAWYILPENINKYPDLNRSQQTVCRNELVADVSFTELNISVEHISRSMFQCLTSFFDITHITALNIINLVINIERFIEVIDNLPNLDAVSLPFILFVNPIHSSSKEINDKYSTSVDNNITKVKLVWMAGLKDVKLLLQLCPMIKYFEITDAYSNDYKLFVQFILTQTSINTPYLHTIGIAIQENAEKIMKELEDMITIDKLTNEFTIKYIDGTIYMQWK